MKRETVRKGMMILHETSLLPTQDYSFLVPAIYVFCVYKKEIDISMFKLIYAPYVDQ